MTQMYPALPLPKSDPLHSYIELHRPSGPESPIFRKDKIDLPG